ncbi:MAG TPA: type VI secretion system baseplate subunit TssK, partial [Longimicrobium sp.]|nr:type VI secretion system baseplate subunit TssK [Longimicrobium sp.]
ALPRLEALMSSGAAHPFAIHLALCDLAGHLAAAGPGRPVPLFRAYDHDDPDGSLGPVLEFCERATQEVQDGFVLIPFRHRRGGFDLAPRAAWRELSELTVRVRGPACAGAAELREWVARARIASASRIHGLAAGDCAGAPREVVPAPAGLPGGEGRLYLRVAAECPWIVPGERLHVLPPVACAGAAPRQLALCLSLAPSATSASTREPMVPA